MSVKFQEVTSDFSCCRRFDVRRGLHHRRNRNVRNKGNFSKIRWRLHRRLFFVSHEGKIKEHYASQVTESRPWRIRQLDKRRIDFAKEWALRDLVPRKWQGWKYRADGVQKDSFTYERISADDRFILVLQISMFRE